MKTIQVLVVEDERIVAEDIKMRLQNLGYKVPGIVFSGPSSSECDLTYMVMVEMPWERFMISGGGNMPG